MSDSRNESSPAPEPKPHQAERRVVRDWEYRTAYLEPFRVRLPPDLHERFCLVAKQKRMSQSGLAVEILEEAVRRREEAAGSSSSE